MFNTPGDYIGIIGAFCLATLHAIGGTSALWINDALRVDLVASLPILSPEGVIELDPRGVYQVYYIAV